MLLGVVEPRPELVREQGDRLSQGERLHVDLLGRAVKAARTTKGEQGMTRSLPHTGAVLGVDVGFSERKRSSAVCRLDWDRRPIDWAVCRFRALPGEREDAIAAVAGSCRLEAAAFDGPLRAGFDVVGRYRLAERMLTQRLGAKIGKPDQASASVGKKLNAAAND